MATRRVFNLLVAFVCWCACALAGAEPTIRNIIVMIPDGVGDQHIALARTVAVARGEGLHLDQMLPLGSTTTHSADNAITDSAAAATAIATGYKTNNDWVSVSPNGEPLQTVLEMAEERSMRTGLITTVMIYDATPAAFAAHTTSRRNTGQIASELLAQGIDVLMGGGLALFESDGLIERAVDAGYSIVRSREDLLTSANAQVLGLFAPEAMAYELDRDGTDEPSLAEMTEAALLRLDNPGGLFLMVEGGKIDWAGHRNDAASIAHDLLAFDEAVGAAMDFADRNGETLIVIVPDHETGGMSFRQDAIAGAGVFFDAVTASADQMARMLAPGRENLATVITSSAPIDSLTSAETVRIMQAPTGFDASTYRFEPDTTLAEIVSSRGGVTFSSADHTDVLVPTFWYGAGAVSDTSEKDNTDIGQLLVDAIQGIEPPVSPTTILYGGTIVTMVAEGGEHEAIAIAGNRILALGTDNEILGIAGPETELIDLDGAAVFPGIIDTHAHVLNAAWTDDLGMDGAQQLAISNGITTSADLGVDPWKLAELIDYARAGNMRLRSRVYLTHEWGCGDMVAFGDSYKEHEPFREVAPRMTIGGIKLYAERSVCYSDPVVVKLSEDRRQYLTEHGLAKGWANAELLYSQVELTRVFREADAMGYQVMIHAIGDAAIEACLDAFEEVLDGRPNTLRHTIQHNTFLRDDMLPRFRETGVLANIQAPEPCEYAIWELFTGTENLDLVMRWRDLLDAGAFVVFGSDWPFWPMPLISRLRALVAGETTNPSYERWHSIHTPCPGYIPQTVTCWEALRMMTADAAYGLHLDESLGTLEEGKLADMVILSGNPLDVAPEDLKNLSVVATYIDGQLEYDATGIFKPADGGAQSQDGIEIESHGTLPGDGAASQSMSQVPEEHDGMLVLDGFSDGDLINGLGYEWVRDSWDGGSFASPVRVEQDADDAHLLLDASNEGGVGVHSSFGETDFSAYDGLYIILSSAADMSLGVNLLSTDAEWPSGKRDTFVNQEMRASDAPTTIRVPFTAFVVEEWRRSTCPACAVDLDPSRILHLGFEIWRGNGELRIHEVGFYRD